MVTLNTEQISSRLRERLSESAMLDLTKRLIAIPSENPPGDQYEECARTLFDELDRLGFDDLRQWNQMDPTRLAADHQSIAFMCQAMSEGFDALREQGAKGLPGNLQVLLSRPLRPFAIWYWSRLMRSPRGELFFAGHARHAEVEMRELRGDVVSIIGEARAIDSLKRLLTW